MIDPNETADSYADRVDARFRRTLDQGDDGSGIRELLAARHVAAGHPVTREELDKLGNGDGLSTLVADIYHALLAACPEALRAFCADHVRVRGIPSFRIEGAVFASKRGNYCLVVTTSLMTFLSKIKKFIFAEQDPSGIEFCNRHPVEDLTPPMLLAMREEIVANFRQGEPRGPLLFLDLKRSASLQMMLAFQERFIIAHEIGHLLSDFLLRGLLTNTLEASFGSPHHRSEYMADLLGFALALKLPFPGEKTASSKVEPWMIEMARISSLCEFFEILEMGFPGATMTHPAPYDRMTNILATYYGDHFAEHYTSWRGGEFPHLDWKAQFELGVTPSQIARTCLSLTTNDGLFQQLVDLAEREGPMALKDMAAKMQRDAQ